jgi:hypothetical protein
MRCLLTKIPHVADAVQRDSGCVVHCGSKRPHPRSVAWHTYCKRCSSMSTYLPSNICSGCDCEKELNGNPLMGAVTDRMGDGAFERVRGVLRVSERSRSTSCNQDETNSPDDSRRGCSNPLRRRWKDAYLTEAGPVPHIGVISSSGSQRAFPLPHAPCCGKSVTVWRRQRNMPRIKEGGGDLNPSFA